MIPTSHLDCLEILNIFSKRKQIGLLSVVKWLTFYSGWIVSQYKMVLSFLNSLKKNPNTGEKDQGECKSVKLKRCLSALCRSWSIICTGAQPHWQGLHRACELTLPFLPVSWQPLSYIYFRFPKYIFKGSYTSVQLYIYIPTHSIVLGLLGFVNRLNKIWIHFSLLLTNIYKYNSEAKWTCSLMEPNKHQTCCPYYISQSE